MQDYNQYGSYPVQSAAPNPVTTIIVWAIVIATVVAMWKVFVKAGKPGWAAIIPIYNVIVLLDIVGRPWWWIFLFLIPLVNIIFAIIIAIDMAKAFGKGTAFGVIGLFLFSAIGYLILGFSDAKYVGVKKMKA